jgi:hypothetical protein
MIARFAVRMPFYLTVPEGEVYQVRQFDDEGYKVRIRPPGRSEALPEDKMQSSVSIDGKPAFQADVIVIDIFREAFDRRTSSPMDPSYALIQRALDWFVDRVRYVTRSSDVQTVRLPTGHWELRYLNDDGSELQPEEGLRRGHGSLKFQWRYALFDREIWEGVFGLPEDFEPPVWDTLRLDALNAMPHVGTVVVLLSTALEVFASQVLERLAARNVAPTQLWQWIGTRKYPDQLPSLDEQLDVLLKLFTGHSMKEEMELWQGFQKLRKVRNSFVHEGVAAAYGQALTPNGARELIAVVDGIISKVREWLPDDLRWPVFTFPSRQVQFETLIPIGRNTAEAENADSVKTVGKEKDG